MAIQIALLRGINLGSRNRIRMEDLRELVEGLGNREVRTHLQSGNVVLNAGTPPAETAVKIEEAISRELGIDVRALVRSRAQLGKVVASNPLEELASDPKRLLVTFLSGKPSKKVLDELDDADFDPEAFVLRGREVYSWHPGGLKRSKLGRVLVDKRLGVTATARNWSTVTKLLEIAET